MKTTLKNTFLTIAGGMLMMVFTSCTEESMEVLPTSVHQVNHIFQREARKRGIKLDYQLEIEWNDNDEVYGIATRRTMSNRVVISLNKRIWDNNEKYPLRREFILMHELGHGVLNREHNKGESFMNIGAMQIINYDKEEREDFEEMRERFYDELFGKGVVWGGYSI